MFEDALSTALAVIISVPLLLAANGHGVMRRVAKVYTGGSSESNSPGPSWHSQLKKLVSSLFEKGGATRGQGIDVGDEEPVVSSKNALENLERHAKSMLQQQRASEKRRQQSRNVGSPKPHSAAVSSMCLMLISLHRLAGNLSNVQGDKELRATPQALAARKGADAVHTNLNSVMKLIGPSDANWKAMQDCVKRMCDLKVDRVPVSPEAERHDEQARPRVLFLNLATAVLVHSLKLSTEVTSTASTPSNSADRVDATNAPQLETVVLNSSHNATLYTREFRQLDRYLEAYLIEDSVRESVIVPFILNGPSASIHDITRSAAGNMKRHSIVNVEHERLVQAGGSWSRRFQGVVSRVLPTGILQRLENLSPAIRMDLESATGPLYYMLQVLHLEGAYESISIPLDHVSSLDGLVGMLDKLASGPATAIMLIMADVLCGNVPLKEGTWPGGIETLVTKGLKPDRACAMVSAIWALSKVCSADPGSGADPSESGLQRYERTRHAGSFTAPTSAFLVDTASKALCTDMLHVVTLIQASDATGFQGLGGFGDHAVLQRALRRCEQSVKLVADFASGM